MSHIVTLLPAQVSHVITTRVMTELMTCHHRRWSSRHHNNCRQHYIHYFNSVQRISTIETRPMIVVPQKLPTRFSVKSVLYEFKKFLS